MRKKKNEMAKGMREGNGQEERVKTREKESGERDEFRVGNFRQKNNSAEDGIYGTNGYFRRNSGGSVEQKTLGIPFRTLLWKRKQLGIPFHGTK